MSSVLPALALVRDYGRRFPRFSGVAAWLCRRPEWTLALFREGRRV